MKVTKALHLPWVMLGLMILFLAPQLQAQKDKLKAKPLPTDPHVRTGRLANGMHYIIRKNSTPKNRAELRLVLNAGAILEEDEQQGLAHFTEHMAFNGSKHFAKNDLIDYLESAGVKFGAHLNAYTSFDETVYMLKVPTDDKEVLSKAFLVMEDWASGLSFDHEEIDKERGVVTEEWRLGLGPYERMRDKYLPVLFPNSMYARRNVIGHEDILANFEYETLKRFYRTWYRPDLMAIVAVGDFDPDEIEVWIEERFGMIPAAEDPVERVDYGVPGIQGTRYASASDPEAAYSMIRISSLHPEFQVRTDRDYREYLLSRLVSGMLYDRMDELKTSGKAAFWFSGFSYYSTFRGTNEFGGSIGGGPGTEKESLRILATEMERARRHGFLITELDRKKRGIIKDLQTQFAERNTTDSEYYTYDYVQSFLDEAATPGVEMELELAQEFLPGITLDEVNTWAKKHLTRSGRYVLATGKAEKGKPFVTEAELQSIVEAAEAADIAPYSEKVDDRPLVASLPAPVKPSAEKALSAIGGMEWTFPNGARVVLIPTEHSDTEVLLQAYKPGGASRYGNEDYHSAIYSGRAISQSGYGDLTAADIRKKTQDKEYFLFHSISSYQSIINGQTVIGDLETSLQLLYLAFTAPRITPEGGEAMRAELNGWQSFSNTPDGTFRDSVESIIHQGHYRHQPLTEAGINAFNPERALEIFRECYSGAEGWTFFFVGAVDSDECKEMIQRYIGGLPAGSKSGGIVNQGDKFPAGKVEREVHKGTEPQSQVSLTFEFPGRLEGMEALEAEAMIEVLRRTLRESMREEKGEVYGVGLYMFSETVPRTYTRISVNFGCAPENVEGLTAEVFKKIREMQTAGPPAKHMTNIKEILLRSWETDTQDNRWWMRSLFDIYRKGGSVEKLMQRPEMIPKLSEAKLKAAANKLFDTKNYVRVVLYPEKD